MHRKYLDDIIGESYITNFFSKAMKGIRRYSSTTAMAGVLAAGSGYGQESEATPKPRYEQNQTKQEAQRGGQTSKNVAAGDIRGENYPLLYVNDGYVCVSSLDHRKTVPLFRGENPKWSPDGTKILYESNEGIHIYETVNQGHKRLTKAGQDPVWAPGGRKFLYLEGDMLKKRIRVFNLETGAESDPAEGSSPQWFDDETLLFENSDTNQLISIHLPSHKTKIVFDEQDGAMLSPDREYLAYIKSESVPIRNSISGYSSFNKIYRLFFCDVDVPVEEEIYSFSQRRSVIPSLQNPPDLKFIDNIRWSPDNQKVAFTVATSTGLSRTDEVMIHFRGKGTTKKILEISDILDINWWPDSSSIVVGHLIATKLLAEIRGQPSEIRIPVRSLRPDFFEKIGIDKALLDNDQLIKYDLATSSSTSFSGHYLDIYKKRSNKQKNDK